MDAAKNAINKLTSGHGHHTTEVHEHYKPAVVHEQINPTREHEDTTVVDNEIHQDHHHTSVLPVQDKQILPTEHSHNIAATKHSEHHHGDHEGIKAKLASEAQQFRDHTETAATQKTHTVAPTIGAEHHHHHVHETIQPVIQKQTIQPSVVHTTIPVHEVHHNEPKHYTASALPAVSLSEFKSQGGSLTGMADRVERFEGEPENIAQKGLGHHGHHDTHSSTTGTSTSQGLTDRTGAGTGTTGSGLTDSSRSGVGSSGYDETSRTGVSSTGLNDSSSRSGLTGNNSSGLGHSSGSGLTGNSSSGLGHSSGSGLTGNSSSGLTDSSRTGGSSLGTGGETSRAQQFIDARVDKPGHHGTSTGSGLTGGSSTLGSNTHSTTTNTSSHSHTDTGAKPSLLSKLNPFKDSDGDGKKGMMD